MSNLASLLKVAFYNTTGINSLSKNIKEGKEEVNIYIFYGCFYWSYSCIDVKYL